MLKDQALKDPFWKILNEQFQIEKEVVIGNDTNRR